MIKRIKIKNFRSIESVDVTLGKVAVLVGRSGTGKTNFVDAIRNLRDMLVRNSFESRESIQPAFPHNGELAYEIVFSVNGLAEDFTYIARFDYKFWQILEEKLSFGDLTLLESPLAKEKYKGDALQLGRIPSNPEVVIAYTTLTNSLGCHHFPWSALTESEASSDSRGLDDDAANYLNVLKDITINLQDLSVRKHILSSIQKLNQQIVAVELDSIQNPTKIIVTHALGETKISLPIEQESDGFRRFLAHLLALYQRPPKQTLIFEEAENGIFPGALELLAEEFKTAFDAGRGQVILTTHSPKLLDYFDADDIRVVAMEGMKTKIGKLAADQRESLHDNLLSPGELLTVDYARIDSLEPSAQ